MTSPHGNVRTRNRCRDAEILIAANGCVTLAEWKSPPGRTTYGFLDFRLDLRTRILLKHGEPVAMTAKVFDTLALLVQRSGQVVTKDEFLRTVWLGAAVEESNLSQNIFLLRKLLGEKDPARKSSSRIRASGIRLCPR